MLTHQMDSGEEEAFATNTGRYIKALGAFAGVLGSFAFFKGYFGVGASARPQLLVQTEAGEDALLGQVSQPVEVFEPVGRMRSADTDSKRTLMASTYIPPTVIPLKTPGTAEAMVLKDHYALVADGPEGLQIFDLSDRLNPLVVSAHSFSDNAHDVVLSGDYALVAAGTAGLRMIEVSDPSRSREVSVHERYDSAGAISIDFVAVMGEQAVIGSRSGWVGTVDVTSPERFVHTAVVTPGEAHAVVLSADGLTAFVADSAGLQVMDVSNKAFPVRVGGGEYSG